MEQCFPLSVRVHSLTLRRQIEEAFSQGNLPMALDLTRKMDSIQLQRWQRQLSSAS